MFLVCIEQQEARTCDDDDVAEALKTIESRASEVQRTIGCKV